MSSICSAHCRRIFYFRLLLRPGGLSSKTTFLYGSFYFYSSSASTRACVYKYHESRPPHYFLQKCLAPREVKPADLDDNFLARKNHVSRLDLSLRESASSEASLCFQVSALPTDLSSARADHKASKLSIATAISEIHKLRADDRRLFAQVSDLNSTLDGLCLQLFNSQSSISPASLDSLCGERDWSFSLLRSSAGQIVRLERGFTNFATRARRSRLSHCCSIGPLLGESDAPSDKDGIPEYAHFPSPTEQFVVVAQLYRCILFS